jgi:hypothetical protein
MALERTPQKVPGTGRNFAGGVRYSPASRVGPAIKREVIQPQAQSNRP